MADTPNNQRDDLREARSDFAYALSMVRSAERAIDDAPEDDQAQIDRLVVIKGQLFDQLMALPAPDLPCLRQKYFAMLDHYRVLDLYMIKPAHALSIARDLDAWAALMCATARPVQAASCAS